MFNIAVDAEKKKQLELEMQVFSCSLSAQAIIVRAEPLLKVKDVQIELMKGIGSVGECINVKLKLFSALEEVNVCFCAEKRICSQTNVIIIFCALILVVN